MVLRDAVGKGDLDDTTFNNVVVAFDLAKESLASYALNTKRNLEEQKVSRGLRLPDDGLSRFHQRLLTPRRQIFVTGRYPLLVSVQDSPTRRWLGIRRDNVGGSNFRGMATSQLYINGTIIERSLASYDRLSWIDDEEIGNRQQSDCYTLELLAEISTRKPGYLNVLPGTSGALKNYKTLEQRNWFQMHRKLKLLDDPFVDRDNTFDDVGVKDILWSSDFSITRKGGLTCLDTETGDIKRISTSLTWPNEMTNVPLQSPTYTDSQSCSTHGRHMDALLVSDGFLVPGRDNGGIYVVLNPGDERERKVQLTGSGSHSSDSEWFYHKSTWVDLTGDGRLSILTARARRPKIIRSNPSSESDEFRPGSGQLVWLERPMPHGYDKSSGMPLDQDGTLFDPFCSSNTPWKVRVLDSGPDVMFSVADLDPQDNTIEVIASQFFGKKLSLHSIKVGHKPKVIFRRTLDDMCGATFSSVLTQLTSDPKEFSNSVIDAGSTVNTLNFGDSFSHILVTSHECKFEDQEQSPRTEIYEKRPGMLDVRIKTEADPGSQNLHIDGGSLFAYEVPKTDWKTAQWKRSVMATGFRVRGQLGNMINPGAPGFCYTFFPKKLDYNHDSPNIRPLIGISGDCAEAAYIFRPRDIIEKRNTDTFSSPCTGVTAYDLLCEIECGATVGSLAVSYSDFCSVEQQSGYAKIFIPCYEKDKILVFALGDGREAFENNDGW